MEGKNDKTLRADLKHVQYIWSKGLFNVVLLIHREIIPDFVFLHEVGFECAPGTCIAVIQHHKSLFRTVIVWHIQEKLTYVQVW